MIMAQETAMFKAKKEFQKIEQAIRQATIEGERIDVIEENLWERMLNLGRLMLTSFVAGQGTGDLGPTLEYEGRILKRLDQFHSKRYQVFSPAIGGLSRSSVSPTSFCNSFSFALSCFILGAYFGSWARLFFSNGSFFMSKS